MRSIVFAAPFLTWLICTSSLHSQKLETHKPDHKTIARVETARDHLTVIELGEPVTINALWFPTATIVTGSPSSMTVR